MLPHIYIYVYTFVHIYIYTHTCLHIYMHTHIYIYIYSFVYIYVCTYTYVCIYIFFNKMQWCKFIVCFVWFIFLQSWTYINAFATNGTGSNQHLQHQMAMSILSQFFMTIKPWNTSVYQAAWLVPSERFILVFFRLRFVNFGIKIFVDHIEFEN